MTEGVILCRQLLPKLNGRALSVLAGNNRRMGLITISRIIALAAVGHKHQIIFRQVDCLLLAALRINDLLCDLTIRAAVNLDIGDRRIVFNLDTVIRQILEHRLDHRLILVVARETECTQIRQTIDMMNVTLQIQLHLKGAVPLLKGKHRLPVDPEVGLVEVLVEHIVDRLVRQFFIGAHEQLQQLHRRLLVHTVFLVGMRILALLFRDAAQGIVRIRLIELVVFREDRLSGIVDRRNRAEQIPHTFEVVVHLSAAAHDVAAALIIEAIARSAGSRQMFKERNMIARHLGVADQEARRRKSAKTGADDPCPLIVNAFRLHCRRKRFIITAGIVHISVVSSSSFVLSGASTH